MPAIQSPAPRGADPRGVFDSAACRALERTARVVPDFSACLPTLDAARDTARIPRMTSLVQLVALFRLAMPRIFRFGGAPGCQRSPRSSFLIRHRAPRSAGQCGPTAYGLPLSKVADLAPTSAKKSMDDTSKPNPQNSAVPAGSPNTQRPAGGETLARAAQGAHAAVDATVGKVAPVIDGVHDKIESAKGAANAAKDTIANGKQAIQSRVDEVGEWISAARDAVRTHPLAALAAAIVVGAAYNSLTSKKR
ncbi:MAG: hypothetical protein ABW032_08345 [Burkholderiaceae bacterium]